MQKHITTFLATSLLLAAFVSPSAPQQPVRLCSAFAIGTKAGVLVARIGFSNVRTQRASLAHWIRAKFEGIVQRVTVGQIGIGKRRVSG